MKKAFDDLVNNIEVRSSLSKLRSFIKDPQEAKELVEMLQDKAKVVLDCLDSEDAKTRKNAALLIGDLGIEEAVDRLYEAYLKEPILFAKSAYLTALEKMDAQSLLPQLRDRLEELLGQEKTEENRKHIDDELRAIRKILIKYEGIETHNPKTYGHQMEVVLLCNRSFRELVKDSVTGGQASIHPLGVLVKTDDLSCVSGIRTYREMLFPVHTEGMVSAKPREAAKQLWNSDLYKIIEDMHVQPGPFYYRIECKSHMELDKRSDFSKKLAAELDMLSGGMLINSTGEYEIEIRLIANKEGMFFPCLRLYTIKDKRFDYRKNAISASIHPATAALIMELSEPYLREDAQIMDPFCGVGTMLIERDKKCKAREIYGTDIFGEAIEKARENAVFAVKRINYIHMNFFDFKHDYLFNEIVTNMPVRGKRTREEMDDFYARFFDKAKTILAPKGIIIMYTNEVGFVKKQLRLHSEYKLVQETCILKKNDFYLFILECR